ncbi:MAG TPA: nucleoside hydrolase, partial [Ilumatobacteraceae bacterium]
MAVPVRVAVVVTHGIEDKSGPVTLVVESFVRLHVNREMKMNAQHRAAASLLSCVTLIGAGALLMTGCADEREATGTTPAVTSGETTVTTAQSDPSDESVPVVLDYSPTISDAGALLYLASEPSVELLAVTLPGTGEADCDKGVRTTVALLTLAGRPHVPVGCGRDAPLVGNRDWPDEWRDAANRFPGVVLPSVGDAEVVDAEALLAGVLAAATQPVTIVAVGPLTNLGVVLADQPELDGAIDRIVVMGGAADVPGNVEQAPTAEWNFYIDPEAVRRVFAAGVAVEMVGLDATDHVPWTDELVGRLHLLDTAVGRAEHQVVTTRGDLTGVYLWDELAALVAVHPDLVTFERRTLAVDDDGATIADAAGASVDVAVAADADAAVDEFLRVLNGGSVPVIEPLDESAVAYLDRLAESTAAFDAAAQEQFGSLPAEPTLANRAGAAKLVGELFAAVGLTGDEIAALEPPEAIADAHEQLVVAATELAGLADAASAAVADADTGDFWTALDAAIGSTGADASLTRIQQACRSIDEYAVVRGHAPVCG